MDIQQKFNKENIIYKITRDIDLEGGTLTIPKGCTLDFQGGSFSNGNISWDNVKIKSNKYKIFNNIIFLENTLFKEIMPEWFGAIGDGDKDDSASLQEMFDILNKCTPPYKVNNLIKPDFSKVKIQFSGKYAVSRPINIPTHYRLNINNLNIIGLSGFQGDYLININEDSFGLSFTNCVFDGGLHASCLGINTYSLDTTIQGCTFVKFKKFGIGAYSTTADGHELKIINTKINQFDYQEFPNKSIFTGIGLYLNSRRHDNNFNNVVINYCTELNYKIEGSSNTFTNCHFYNKDKITYNESGQYNTFQSCYFDGVGTTIKGATTIDSCFYSLNIDDPDIPFIKIKDDINWLNGFTLIRNNIFRNNSANTSLYKTPIQYIGDGVKDYTFIDNRFLKVQEYRHQSSNFKGTLLQTNTERIFKDNKNTIRLGNLMIQFGSVSSIGESPTSITFDIPYEEKVLVIVTPFNSSSDSTKCFAYNVSNKGFAVNNTTFNWVAIGNKNI